MIHFDSWYLDNPGYQGTNSQLGFLTSTFIHMNRPKTWLATLYRFVPGVRGSHEEMFDAYTQYVSEQSLDERHADTEFFEVAGVPAIWIGIQEEEKEAEWTEEFTTTTGLDLAYSERRGGGALLRQAAHARHAIPVLPGHPGPRRQDPRHVWHRRGGRRHPGRVDRPSVSGYRYSDSVTEERAR